LTFPRPTRGLALCALIAVEAMTAAARAEQAPAAPAAPAAAAPPPRQYLEVTFGNSQLFAHQSFLGAAGTTREEIIPVPSALLMIEWLWHERFSALTFVNFPLDTQKVVVNGAVQESYDAPSLAVGIRVTAIRFEVFTASRLELQLAALGGVTVGSENGDKVFPLAAGRIHFCNRDGFALYLGGAFAFHKDTAALLYGIGHRF
jgi:hypothetical protein